ncbi:ubiquinol-cytochrome C chaperone family protein [Rhizobium sp. L1K21]|uniref:ubiquinol-cytochrome C chaperone family protein n=1 Tax=Rhizobium sp. L1K21 TaxID=2954933 RepID=UPI0020925827|nr:ubiquinol-cytochrome C chaperone family protein [Rhizobium sp. L1K21]MCO6185831.1 ubiquinol-cytochrome C chaperone [Rhizobium sp. L1K21]
MFFGLFGKKNSNRVIVERQYANLTAGARQPAFYASMDVPDTVMGRFEMLSLALILYFRRTAEGSRSGHEIAQEIVDAFFEDLDHSIRELGVGDLSVPKRMKKLASMFYGRLEAYSKALDAQDGELLAAALKRNFHPQNDAAPAMDKLAAYAIHAETHLKTLSEDVIATGEALLPEAQ